MIAPTAVPTLWKVAHDRTEITAGEFLEELAAIPFVDEAGGDRRIELGQQTLSNYVRWGWVPRSYVGTAPGGRGQTGYFERRALILAIFAHEKWAPHREELTAKHRKTIAQIVERAASRLALVDLLVDYLLLEYWFRDWPIALSPPRSSGEVYADIHLHRAVIIRCVSLLLEAVPLAVPNVLLKFAPEAKGREAIEELRAELDRAIHAPVESGSGSEQYTHGHIKKPLRVWLASKPGDVAVAR